MRHFKIATVTVVLAASAVALSACSDGYGRERGYSSVSIGVSSKSEHGFRDRDHDGIPNRYDRDRNADGVPNRCDDAPDKPNYR